MAKKNNGFDFADFLKSLKENEVKPADIEVRQERKYFLIVSEGVRTEPIYFEYWAKKLPKNLIKSIEVHGEGDNTVNVVQKAIELKEKRKKTPNLPDYDEVWAVFDKDDFPTERYQNAITLAQNNGIESGHSNQSFELWYVLHFEYLQAALHRSDYIKKLTDKLGYKYAKNSLSIVKDISEKGDLNQAIKRAYELEKLHEGEVASNACPYTRLYVLVDRLQCYLENTKNNY